MLRGLNVWPNQEHEHELSSLLNANYNFLFILIFVSVPEIHKWHQKQIYKKTRPSRVLIHRKIF